MKSMKTLSSHQGLKTQRVLLGAVCDRSALLKHFKSPVLRWSVASLLLGWVAELAAETQDRILG